MDGRLDALPEGERVLFLIIRHGGFRIDDLRRLLSEPVSDTLQLLIRGSIWEYVDSHINWLVDKTYVLALLRETDRQVYSNDYRLDLRWLSQFSRSFYSGSMVFDKRFDGWSQELIDRMRFGPLLRRESSHSQSSLPSIGNCVTLPSEIVENICLRLDAAQDLCRVIAAFRADKGFVQRCKERLLEVVRDSVVNKVERALALDRGLSLASVQPLEFLQTSILGFRYIAYPDDFLAAWGDEVALVSFPEPVWFNHCEAWRSGGVERVRNENRVEALEDGMSGIRGWTARGYYAADTWWKPNWPTDWGG